MIIVEQYWGANRPGIIYVCRRTSESFKSCTSNQKPYCVQIAHITFIQVVIDVSLRSRSFGATLRKQETICYCQSRFALFGNRPIIVDSIFITMVLLYPPSPMPIHFNQSTDSHPLYHKYNIEQSCHHWRSKIIVDTKDLKYAQWNVVMELHRIGPSTFVANHGHRVHSTAKTGKLLSGTSTSRRAPWISYNYNR